MRRAVLSLTSVIVVLAFFVSVLHSSSQVFAQTPPQAVPSMNEFSNNVTQDTVDGNYSLDSASTRTTAAQLGGIGTLITGLVDDQGNPIVGGAIPEMGKGIAFLIKEQPASGMVWLADVFQQSPFVPQAYAQGIGFKALSPILPIWKTFRDLSYVFFVIIFVVIGFMIMFRQKMGGQAAVTISSALPNIFISLIAITFSYAVPGFMIDLMYIVIYFIVGIFSTIINEPSLVLSGQHIRLVDIALSQNIFSNGFTLIFRGGGSNGSVVGGAAAALGEIVESFFSSGRAGTVLSSVAGGITGIVGFLIFALAVFFAVVKTFFELLKSYVTFIVSIVFSPFMLLLGAINGKTDFKQWFVNLISCLAPFPVVITMIFLAMAFGGYGQDGVGFHEDQSGGFQAPQITISQNSQGGASNAVQGLIAIGVLMLMPEAVKMSKEALGAKNPFEKYTADILKNLDKGWKGGQIVDGIGPKVPGVQNFVPGMLKSGGGAVAGGVIGGLGGAGVGGVLEYNRARGMGMGRGSSLAAAGGATIVGGALGTLGGAVVGGGAPVAVSTIKTVSKYTEPVKKFAKNADEIYNVGQQFVRKSSASKRNEAGRSPTTASETEQV